MFFFCLICSVSIDLLLIESLVVLPILSFWCCRNSLYPWSYLPWTYLVVFVPLVSCTSANATLQFISLFFIHADQYFIFWYGYIRIYILFLQSVIFIYSSYVIHNFNGIEPDKDTNSSWLITDISSDTNSHLFLHISVIHQLLIF